MSSFFNHFILFLVCSISLSSYGDVELKNCSNFNFSNQFGPQRDQYDRGFCFANAMSDIIGQSLDFDKDKQVSSYDVAIQTYLGRTGLFQEIKDKFGDKFNITKYEYLDQTRGDWSRKYQESSKKIPYSLLKKNYGGKMAEGIYSYNFAGGICLEKKLPIDLGLVQNRSTSVRDIETVLERNEAYIKKETQSVCINKTQEASIAKVQNALLKDLVDQACSPRTPLKAPLIPKHINYKMQSEDPINEIRTAFENHRTAAVTVDMNIISPNSYLPNSLHALVVTEQKWNSKTQKCELRMRNSWGTKCEGIIENGSCEKDGSFWITSDIFKKAITESVWILKLTE